MSNLSEEFTKHPVHTTAKSLKAAMEDEAFGDIAPPIRTAFDRLVEATSYVDSTLKFAIPILTTKAQLDSVNSWLQNI